MNREQRQASLRSHRTDTLESLAYGVKYRKHRLFPSDTDDDETMIVQLETSENEVPYICTSWPTCFVESYDVSRINNGILRCTMAYMGQRTVRETIRGTQVTSVVYFESNIFVNKRNVESTEFENISCLSLYIDGSSSLSASDSNDTNNPDTTPALRRLELIELHHRKESVVLRVMERSGRIPYVFRDSNPFDPIDVR